MKTGNFEIDDEQYEQLHFIYDKIKCDLPPEYGTFELFCGTLVYGGLTSYCKELHKMGVI